ncbi:MAG: hypothetical protein ACK41F_03545 [Fimbriimonadaceae bacterium]
MPEDEQKPPEASAEPAPQPPADPVLDDLERRMEALGRRAGEARSEHRRSAERSRPSLGDSAHGVGYGLTIAYTILGLPMLGVLVGWILDQRSGTGQLFTGLGVLVGSVVALLAVLVQISRFEKRR